MKMIKYFIVSPSGIKAQGECRSFIFPGCDGMLGIMPGRAPLVSPCLSGYVSIDGKKTAVNSAILTFKDNILTLCQAE